MLFDFDRGRWIHLRRSSGLTRVAFLHAFSVAQLANALALASLLTILASGLALIFGLRDVMNFAHRTLCVLGAYIGYTVSGLLAFWVALVIVPVALALLGVALEYATIRPLQKRSRMD